MESYKQIITYSILNLFLLFIPIQSYAEENGVVFWNKMEVFDGTNLTSEVGQDLSLTGTNWSLLPAMFENGWDNNTESTYAYANSSELINSIREGALAFWWVPIDDGDTVFASPFGSARKDSVFFSNGATNSPQNNKYNFEFWYAQHASPASFFINLYKRAADGTTTYVQMHAGLTPYTGTWQAGDKVHIAFAWHNEPVILDQYIAALWVDGVLAYGWVEPVVGTLESWKTTNPVQAFSPTMRIGDSIFSYSMDEQLRGPIDNIVFRDYAKSDYSDRFVESPLALPPTADAGPNKSIHVGDVAMLDGSGSFDDVTPSEALMYDWSFITTPEGSTASLTSANSINSTFIADLPGTYDVSLVVTDEDGLSSPPSQVIFSSYNTPPNADAGSDQASYVGSLVLLDASASHDPDDDLLTYSWIVNNMPTGSTAQLVDQNTIMPTIEPDLPGSYEVSLTVNDGLVDSTPDSVTLTIITVGDYAQQQIGEAINVTVDLPPTSITTSGNQKALLNFLTQSIKQLNKDNTVEALTKLASAIARTDGCALRGAPDMNGGGEDGIRKDYVSNCDDQSFIYSQLTNAQTALQ